MKNIIMSIIISIALIISVYLYTERTRYDIIAIAYEFADIKAIKIDHISGQMWRVNYDGVEILIERK